MHMGGSGKRPVGQRPAHTKLFIWKGFLRNFTHAHQPCDYPLVFGGYFLATNFQHTAVEKKFSFIIPVQGSLLQNSINQLIDSAA